jgi:alpha-glucosidase
MSGGPWWRDGVVYQIYPRSFASSMDATSTDGGVGDLRGITARLDHLVWLGVDALWLSPFYRSPMRDFGYDVADHCDVDPRFGTLADFDALVAAAHARGLRVIVDWVPAHVSSDHPWFRDARTGRGSVHRDWFVWADPGPGGAPPNNWRSTFTDGPAWTLDEATGQFYLHSFLPEQPDLTWADPRVRRAMHDVLRFWMARGVDGFRADVVHNVGKDPALADVPAAVAGLPHFMVNDEPVTHEYLREVRRVLDEFPGDRMMVGEVFLLDPERMAAYHGHGDELHLCFNFAAVFAPWSAPSWRACIDRTAAVLGARDAWPTWVLSNHDLPRHRTRYGSEARARAAAVLLLALRGTPFLYMGEELGLEDAPIPPALAVDPGGRDGCRAPLPWHGDAGHGWGTPTWLPFPPDAATRNVADLKRDATSILHLYRRLLAARRAAPALRRGTFEWLPAPESVLAFRRTHEEDTRVVLVNFGDDRVRVELPAPCVVEIASDGIGEGAAFDQVLGASQALVLREPPPAA